MTLPGSCLLRMARWIVGRDATAHFLEPLVADWQREWLAAATPMRRVTARLRGAVAFACCAVYCGLVADVPRDVHRRAWTTLAAFSGVGTAILTVPFAAIPPSLLIYWLPSQLVVTVAFAMLPWALLLGTSADRGAGRRYLARMAGAIALVIFVAHGWLVPYANQTFRVEAARQAAERAGKTVFRRPLPGLRETTSSALLQAAISPDNPMTRDARASRAQFKEELSSRAAMPLMPLLLAMFGWSLARGSQSAGAVRLVGWWTFAALTYVAARGLRMTFERHWDLPREAAVWLPLLLWLGATAVLHYTRREPPQTSAGTPFGSLPAQ